MSRLRRILAVFVLAVALSISGVGVASAAITPVDTACQNQGGNYPSGQQPSCQGGGLEQESENQNPAGKAPRGHNK